MNAYAGRGNAKTADQHRDLAHDQLAGDDRPGATDMADERGLEGLDPYELMDRESERLATRFGSLEPAEWATPSGCEGWSLHDLLAHLVAVEEYFSACLEGTVGDLMQRYGESGATSLDEFNAVGVANSDGAKPAELLSTWQKRNDTNRAGWREADGNDVDTSVGPYPGRLQAFHVAFEYAIHANDAGAHVAEAERDARQDWLAAIAWLALTEVRADTTVERNDGSFVVRRGADEITIGRDDFVAGVSARAEPGQLDPAATAMLDLGY